MILKILPTLQVLSNLLESHDYYGNQDELGILAGSRILTPMSNQAKTYPPSSIYGRPDCPGGMLSKWASAQSMISININPIINIYVIYALPPDVIALGAQQVSVVFCEEAQDRQVNLWHNFYFYSLVLPLLRLLVLTFKISGKTGQSFENRLPLQLLLPLLPTTRTTITQTKCAQGEQVNLWHGVGSPSASSTPCCQGHNLAGSDEEP